MGKTKKKFEFSKLILFVFGLIEVGVVFFAIQGFDARSSFFVDTDNHSGSPSSICSLGDRAAAVFTTLFRFSHVSNPFQIGMYDNSVLHCLLQSLLQLLQCLLHIRRD